MTDGSVPARYWESLDLPDGSVPARYWESLDLPDGSARCLLCPHRCAIPMGKTGRCRVRANFGGSLVASAYGVVSALALDPIEKKPLARFHSGSRVLSAGFYGCNLSCAFCQNHEISQRGVPGEGSLGAFGYARFSPDGLVSEALLARNRGNIGLAFTYNEPFTNFEFMLDCARSARESGLLNVIVTNGFVNPDPLEEILPFVDAMNIDLKSWNDGFYRELCGASLPPVLRTIERAARSCHVEATTLLIPGLNDSEEEIDSISSWLASVSADIDLHLTRHHPAYRLSEPDPIAVDRLTSLAGIARARLKYVHCGNV